MIVADASAVLDMLLARPSGRAIEERLLRRGDLLFAPHLVDLEVANVLLRGARSGEITDQRARDAIHDFFSLPIDRYPHTVLLGRIWDLRHNFTAYDAAYVALAEALDATLVTSDARLGRVAERLIPVEIF